MDAKFKCPECGSFKVVSTAEQMFMVNTGEHYCHSVKAHDDDAKAKCLECDWVGQNWQLVPEYKKGK
jgi:transcription elongation factor Elf1